MKHIRAAAVTISALALAAMPTVAFADGAQAFKNCTEAYDAGYSNIPASDPHYAKHLDRDGDGIGCDNPPSDFEPAQDTSTSDDNAQDDSDTTAPAQDTQDTATGQDNPDLAETGSNSATPYYAAGGAAVVLAGAGVLVATRKRRSNN